MPLNDFRGFAESEGFGLPSHFEADGTVQRITKADAVYCADSDAGALIVTSDDIRPFGDLEAVQKLLERADIQAKHLERHVKSKQLASAGSAEVTLIKETVNPAYDKPFFPDVKEARNGAMKVLNTDENLKALGEYCGLDFRFNLMTYRPEIVVTATGEIHNDYEQLKSMMISEGNRYDLPKSAIDDHLIALCMGNKYHPVKDWLDAGAWDGTKRFDSVVKCLNAKRHDLALLAMKRWCVGAVASLYEENFKSKLVPVLQGGQSFRKTAFVDRIAHVVPSAFLEGAELNPDNKDSVMTFISHWLVELGELERTTKNSQGSLKGFFTKAVDTVRPPYGRSDIEKPRQTSCIATVNGADFLKDETGSSRFAVIELADAVDLDTLNELLGWRYQNSRLRQIEPELLRQFWLEVKAMYDTGENWNLSADEVELFAPVNNMFNDRGVLYDYIRDCFLKDPDHYINKGWFTAGGYVDGNTAMQGKDSRQVGKALKQLVNEGLCESRPCRGRAVEYRFLPLSEAAA